jgi:hypothetical protein
VLSIYFATMADRHHPDNPLPVGHLVEDAVIADTDAVRVAGAGQLLRAAGCGSLDNSRIATAILPRRSFGMGCRSLRTDGLIARE